MKGEVEGRDTIYSIPGLRMPKSILFGNGSIEEIGREVKKLGGKKAIIITDRNLVKSGLLEKPKQVLERENIDVTLFEDVEFEPTTSVVEKGRNAVKERQCDIVIGIGGGSVLDATKVTACLAKNVGKVEDYLGKSKGVYENEPFKKVPKPEERKSIEIDKEKLKEISNKNKGSGKAILLDESLRIEVKRALTTLSDREAEVIKLYFGLEREHPLTLEEIGERFNLTRERVRQIKEKAIRRLRHTSRSRMLRSYLG